MLDDLSSGSRAALGASAGDRRLAFRKLDLARAKDLARHLRGHDIVWHLAANPDVRAAITGPAMDFEKGLLATFRLLEGVRRARVPRFAFASSSTVYGETQVLPTPETHGPLVPISVYGAAKLGAEGLVSSYAHTFDVQAWIFRFANVVGPRGTHGVIVDFLRKLRADPRELEILGDGNQRKSYLTVDDCLGAMEFAIDRSPGSPGRTDLLNIGTLDQVTVRRIADIVIEELGLKDVRLRFTGGARGWRGDVPVMLLGIDRLRELGWRPSQTSEEAVRAAVRHLIAEGAGTPAAASPKRRAGHRRSR